MNDSTEHDGQTAQTSPGRALRNQILVNEDWLLPSGYRLGMCESGDFIDLKVGRIGDTCRSSQKSLRSRNKNPFTFKTVMVYNQILRGQNGGWKILGHEGLTVSTSLVLLQSSSFWGKGWTVN